MEAVMTVEDGRPVEVRDLPSPAVLGQSVLGFLALGVAVALGSPDSQSGLHHLPAALMIDAGSLVLTGPALLVGHQFLSLDAPVTALAGDLLWAFTRSGGMALGLTHVFLFFASTSGLAPGLLALALPIIGGIGLAHASVGLVSSESGAGVDSDRTLRMAKMRVLLTGWLVLTALVGARLGLRMVLS